MTEPQIFTWTFPLHVIVVNPTILPESNRLVFDDKLSFVAPPWGPDECLAIFTDNDLARRFRESCPDQSELVIIGLQPKEMLALLRSYSDLFQSIMIDCDAKSGRGIVVPNSHLVDAIEWYLSTQNESP